MSEPHGPDEDVGSLVDEATKLVGALADWARENGVETGAGGSAGAAGDESSGASTGATVGGESLAGLLGAVAARAAEVGRGFEQHVATGAPECAWCPVCRAVHVVRQTSPEVRAHLATAASSLLQAAAGMLATAVPDGVKDGSADGVADGAAGDSGGAARDARSSRGAGVERIDLDADGTDRSGTDPAWPEEDA